MILSNEGVVMSVAESYENEYENGYENVLFSLSVFDRCLLFSQNLAYIHYHDVMYISSLHNYL
jgi:hypothetical protein